MPTYYQGKLTFSDFVPGLSSAASELQEKNAEVEDFLSNKQKSVDGLSNRVTAIQDELTRSQQVAADAQQALAAANQALTEAKDLVNEVADALNASGIYHYNYVGRIDNMGSSLQNELGGGLPDKQALATPGDETVAAVILISGGDGGTTVTLNRIGSLMGQIGGNAQEIKDAYTVESGS